MGPVELRAFYEEQSFDEGEVDGDPFVVFRQWFDHLMEHGYFEPFVATLATVSDDAWPSARNVIVRGMEPSGFLFYTNYTSDKARDVDTSGRACLHFNWTPVHRQVRIVGTSARATAAESDSYWQTRPRGSQLAVWASDQSAVINDRATLLRQYDEVAAGYEGRELPRPSFWGGYRVVPRVYEFWQGREHRLHDRIRYTYDDHGGAWRIDRLAP